MCTADSQCPDGWVEENEGGVRACGRGTVGASCQSAFFNNDHQMEYTKVCGRAVGYQYGTLMHFMLVLMEPSTKFMLMDSVSHMGHHVSIFGRMQPQ